MKQVYFNSILQLNKYISLCGKELSIVSDQYTLIHWQNQLNKTITRKSKIEKRLKLGNNVVFVDFINKKRVA